MKSSTIGLGLSFGQNLSRNKHLLLHKKNWKKKTAMLTNTYRVRMSGEENSENVGGVGIYSMNHYRESQKSLRWLQGPEKSTLNQGVS